MSNGEEGDGQRDVRTTHLSQARFTGAEEMELDMMKDEEN
jgi:hypothetical protein